MKEKKEKMIPVHWRIPEYMIDELNKIAKAEFRNQASVVRLAIHEFLERRRK